MSFLCEETEVRTFSPSTNILPLTRIFYSTNSHVTAGAHVHGCARKFQQESADAELERIHTIRECKWKGCQKTFDSHQALGMHVRETHSAGSPTCYLEECDRSVKYHHDGIELEHHIYLDHNIRLHRHADIKWCYICQEWYCELDDQGNFILWEEHCEAHFVDLFSPFSHRIPHLVEPQDVPILLDGKFIEFVKGEGFAGTRPEFHGHIMQGLVLTPFFCPWCVYDEALPFSKRVHQ